MIADTFAHGLDRLGSAARAGLSALSHRGELAALEAGEARDHLAGTVALGLAATALTVLGGFALNFAVAAGIWHRDDRALLLALFAGLQLALAAGLAFWTHRRLSRWQPLRETRRQLRQDGEMLQTLLPGGAAVADDGDRAPPRGSDRETAPPRAARTDGTARTNGAAEAAFQPTARGPLS